MSVFVRFILSALAVCAWCVMLSCGGRHADGDARSDSLLVALAAADDSADANSPHTLGIIKAAMRASADSLDYYDWYLRLMRYYVQHGVADTSQFNWNRISCYLSGRELTPRVRGMWGNLLNTKANYSFKVHHDPALTARIYTEAYHWLAGSDDEDNMPNVCANLGDAYVMANDMPLAAQWYRRALFLADSLRLPAEDNVDLYVGLGRIYLKLGDFDSARGLYKEVGGSYSRMSLNMKLYYLVNYGNYLYYSGDYKGAETVFAKEKRLLEEGGMKDGYDMYVCKLNMADVCLNLGKWNSARRLLGSVYGYFKSLGDDTALHYCHTILIALALRDGDTAAVGRILAGERINTTIDFNLVDIRHRYLRDYYVKKGDYRRAYQDLQEGIRRNDSLKHNISNMRASEIMMRYAQDTLQLNHQIAMQAKDADIRTARLGLYIVLMAAAALALLLLYGYTYSRKRRLSMQVQLMQLRLLNVRSRLSPHFIFNVLNNRIAHTDKQGAEELMTLVKLIRANLKMSGKDYVSLKEELDFVGYYVSVERQCLGGGFDFEVDAPPDSVLESVMVPSMFIQILVENSIKHGLKGCEGYKRLRVTVTADGAYCRVTVADNGAGFDIRRGDPSSTKTGLKVIRNTINIINHGNKRKTRLEVRNIKGADGTVAGCEVTLVLPLGMKPVCGSARN